MDKTTKIIVVVAVIAVIGVIAWYVYSQKSTKTEEKKETTNNTPKKESSTLQNIFFGYGSSSLVCALGFYLLSQRKRRYKMSKLSGWSLFWLAMTATCIIATVFSLIQANRKKKLKQNTDIGKVVGEDFGFFRSGNDGIGYLGGTKVF